MIQDPVGVAEIADRLGVKRQTVAVWKVRGLLPEPDVQLAMGPLWAWPSIAKWARKTGRMPNEENR